MKTETGGLATSILLTSLVGYLHGSTSREACCHMMEAGCDAAVMMEHTAARLTASDFD